MITRIDQLRPYHRHNEPTDQDQTDNNNQKHGGNRNPTWEAKAEHTINKRAK